MDKPAARASQNIVQRRVPAARARVEARTTEFDCTGIASLYDAHEAAAKQATPDLEAEIEIETTDTSDAETKRGGRLAHTLRRDGARGSQPAVDITPRALPLPAPAPEPITPNITVPMPVMMATELAQEAALEPPMTQPASRTWWIVAGAAVVTSGLALVGVLLS